MTYWRITRHVHLLIPEELLVEVDSAATKQYMCRSEFIRYVLDKEVTGRYSEKVEEAERRNPTLFANLDEI
jgi:metal-responsive CopG/Arc/MetJ family transcriptional regulator